MGFVMHTGKGKEKKSLDAELNLIPFIDLLVVNICFLLITAVWVNMSRIKVSDHQGPSENSLQTTTPIVVLVGEEGYVVTMDDQRLVVPKQGKEYDSEKLGLILRQIKSRHPERNWVSVAAVDGTQYRHLILAIDTTLKENYDQVSVRDSTGVRL